VNPRTVRNTIQPWDTIVHLRTLPLLTTATGKKGLSGAISTRDSTGKKVWFSDETYIEVNQLRPLSGTKMAKERQ
jgi:hypothetical protein